MDFTNIESLLNFTVSLPKEELTSLAGFEFGNEILVSGVSPKRYSFSLWNSFGLIVCFLVSDIIIIKLI